MQGAATGLGRADNARSHPRSRVVTERQFQQFPASHSRAEQQYYRKPSQFRTKRRCRVPVQGRGQKLSELNREGICFITLRRRSDKMLREIYSQPDSAWQRISLPALTRIYRNPKVLENRVTLPGYEGELRQLTIMGIGTRGADRPVDLPPQTRPGRTRS